MYALAIPVLLVLELAVAVERRAHRALSVLRRAPAPPERPLRRPVAAAAYARCGAFLATDAGMLSAVGVLAGTGILGLLLIR